MTSFRRSLAEIKEFGLSAFSIPLLYFTLYFVISAYCRNSVDGQWYSYDDSSAEPVPEAEVCTRGAYILFYQRRNTIPPWSASSSVTGQSFQMLQSALLLLVGWNLLHLIHII